MRQKIKNICPQKSVKSPPGAKNGENAKKNLVKSRQFFVLLSPKKIFATIIVKKIFFLGGSYLKEIDILREWFKILGNFCMVDDREAHKSFF